MPTGGQGNYAERTRDSVSVRIASTCSGVGNSRGAVESLGDADEAVVQNHQLIRPEWQGSVRAAFIVVEFHFKETRFEQLYDGANLSAPQAMAR